MIITMCINNNNNNNVQLKDLILLQDVSSKMFVSTGVVIHYSELQYLLSVQSSVNGVEHTSNMCDISTNFDHHQETI
jgi:hypothetical protein